MLRDAMACRLTHVAALALGLVVCAPAPAQPAGSPEPLVGDGPGLIALDQAVEDLSSLSSSLRLVQPRLDVPNGFDRVYRLPGPDGKLMRVQGGLYAIFDESVYAAGRGGLHVLVPANTTFWIGPPPDLLGAGAAPPAYRDRIDDLIVPAHPGSLRLEAGTAARSEERCPRRTDEGRIVWDDDYRARRLRRLMETAARAAAPE